MRCPGPRTARSGGRALNEANQQWLTDDFFPRLSKTSLQALSASCRRARSPHWSTSDRSELPTSRSTVLSVAMVEEAYAVAARLAVGGATSS
jgi:hypothetical protein